MHSNPDLFWLKWGVWLQASVAAVVLIMEVVWKVASRRADQEVAEQFIKLVRLILNFSGFNNVSEPIINRCGALKWD
ncbi:MAG: hypothetical protein IBX69_07915 [Anaerolineales bacterium]|nr:hypothetical protein [Anaerolineales bacterium]